MPPKKKKEDTGPVYKGVYRNKGMYKARVFGWQSGEYRPFRMRCSGGRPWVAGDPSRGETARRSGVNRASGTAPSAPRRRGATRVGWAGGPRAGWAGQPNAAPGRRPADIYLGHYWNQERAAQAYDIALIKLRGLYGAMNRTNFPMDSYQLPGQVEAVMVSPRRPAGPARARPGRPGERRATGPPRRAPPRTAEDGLPGVSGAREGRGGRPARAVAPPGGAEGEGVEEVRGLADSGGAGTGEDSPPGRVGSGARPRERPRRAAPGAAVPGRSSVRRPRRPPGPRSTRTRSRAPAYTTAAAV